MRFPVLVRGGEGGGDAGRACFVGGRDEEKEKDGKRERAAPDEDETADEVRGRRCVLAPSAGLNAAVCWREEAREGQASCSSPDKCELLGVSGQLDSGACVVVASRISSYRSRWSVGAGRGARARRRGPLVAVPTSSNDCGPS